MADLGDEVDEGGGGSGSRDGREVEDASGRTVAHQKRTEYFATPTTCLLFKIVQNLPKSFCTSMLQYRLRTNTIIYDIYRDSKKLIDLAEKGRHPSIFVDPILTGHDA